MSEVACSPTFGICREAFVDPEALVVLGETPADEPGVATRAVRYATVEAWRERAGSLATIEAFDGTNVTLTELGAAERLSVTSFRLGSAPHAWIQSWRCERSRPRRRVSAE